MLLNISTDRIIFIAKHEHIILPYGELEKEISQLLYQHIATYSEPLIVINGPGSFTNLRIATLALNTYNMLHNFSLDFVSIPKIDWYSMLYNNRMTEGHNNLIIKRYCVMYIGQKKNFWVVDLANAKNDRMTEGQNDGIVKLHIDKLKEYVDTLGSDWFVDEMVAEGKDMIDSVLAEGSYKMYTFQEKDGMTEGQRETVKMLEPHYIIQPNID